jgi:septal ring factor EnvC (AmiA/AmiB activator)
MVVIMPLENHMRDEMRKLEKEIAILDDELERLHTKILQLIMIRKKKEHDLKVFRENVLGYDEDEDGQIQTTLAKLLKEKY